MNSLLASSSALLLARRQEYRGFARFTLIMRSRGISGVRWLIMTRSVSSAVLLRAEEVGVAQKSAGGFDGAREEFVGFKAGFAQVCPGLVVEA